MFVFIHRIMEEHGGCRKGWCVLLQILLRVLTVLTSADGTTYWAHIPDPPLLHPTVWEGPQVLVGTNDTASLPHPYVVPDLTSVPYNYSGYGTGLPICFSRGAINNNFTGCLPVRARTIEGATQRVIVTQPPEGTKASSSVTPPQTVDPCEKEKRQATKLHYGETVISNPGGIPSRDLIDLLLTGPEEMGHIKTLDNWE